MKEIEDILKRLSDIFEQVDLDYVLVGGLAAIIRGKPRTTMNIDLIISNDEVQIKKFLQLLKQYNFDVMDQQVKLAFESNVNASIFDNKSSMRLDIKIAKSKLDNEALNNYSEELLSEVSIKTVSVEYILLGKIWFLGDISDLDESEFLEYNDIKDFINVYQKNKEKINFYWLEKKSKELNLTETLNRVVKFIEKEF